MSTYNEDEEEWMKEWQRTGRLTCDDCGATVHCENLTSLPEHGCSRRQQARREREREGR